MIHKMAAANKGFLLLCLLLVSSVAIATHSFLDDESNDDYELSLQVLPRGNRVLAEAHRGDKRPMIAPKAVRNNQIKGKQVKDASKKKKTPVAPKDVKGLRDKKRPVAPKVVKGVAPKDVKGLRDKKRPVAPKDVKALPKIPNNKGLPKIPNNKGLPKIPNNKGKQRKEKTKPFQANKIWTQYLGDWEVHNGNVGVNAMQLQLMPNNKAVWFDTTTLGPSFRKLDPPGYCPASFEMGGVDCFAHALSYDIETGNVRTLKIDGDPWCSSGGLDVNGHLLGTGGNKKGVKTIRRLKKCDKCEFEENHNALYGERWYSTQQILGDGSIIVVGGRNAFSYDLIPGPGLNMKARAFDLPFLRQTTAPPVQNTKGPNIENNLYPFVYFINDKNVFTFANDRAILINPYQGQVTRQYPVLPGGSRNYPPSGMSALLPYKLDLVNRLFVDPEVVVCGGNSPNAFGVVDSKHTNEKVYMPALQDCWRIKVLDPKANWVREQDMPSRRTMGDLLHLPTGDLLFINGAKRGTSGWEDAVEPNLTPVLYSPDKPFGQRFKELKPTTIPRMYHSSSALLPDGKILVTGSNAHQYYQSNGPFPTDMRVEKFTPPNLDKALSGRPSIMVNLCKTEVRYGEEFDVHFKIPGTVSKDLKVTMIAPPFTTHGFSMNQRMLFLPVKMISVNKLTAVAPAAGGIAPPGYYMLFLVHNGVPSRGMWVRIR